MVFPSWTKSAGAREGIDSVRTEIAYGKCRIKRTKGKWQAAVAAEGAVFVN